MPTLLDGVSANTTGAAQTHSGPTTVYVRGVTDGATIVLQISDTTHTANFVKPDRTIMPQSIFRDQKGVVAVDAQGTYSLRAILSNAGASTSVTVTSTQ